MFKKYTRHPVLAIIDVQPQDDMGIPTDAYVSVEEVKDVSRSGALIFGSASLRLHAGNHVTVIAFISMTDSRHFFSQDGTPTRRSFQHLPSEIGAEEVRYLSHEVTIHGSLFMPNHTCHFLVWQAPSFSWSVYQNRT